MLINEALNRDYEIIEGVKFMAPAANPLHSGILFKLSRIIDIYMDSHDGGYVFTDNIDVHFPDGNVFRPDVTVITAENSKIINWNKAIQGVPDMVV